MRIAFITGGSSGTGRGICERFAQAGWGICLTSRNEESAKGAAAELAQRYHVPTFGFGLSAGNEAEVTAIFRQLHQAEYCVQALILCAADLGMDQNSLSVPLEEFRRVLETNLVWNFSICRAAAEQMRQAGGGAIVFIGSNTSRRAIPDRAAYIASKGGLTSLSKALAIDWGGYGIRVNIIHSGSIKTARWAAQTEEWRQVRRDRAPIGDIADFEDIANVAFFLASDEARIITGAELTVDGGVDAQFVPRAMA